MRSIRSLYTIILITLSIFYLGCGSSKPALDTPLTREQQNIRAQLFERIDNTIEAAKRMDAHLYSPKNFETGMRHFVNAENLLRQERGIENIRIELDRATVAFERSIETAELGSVTFTSAIAARNDALKAESPLFSPENWKRAEAQFRNAAEALEAGNVTRARQEAQAAENQYRSVELEAIKANYLTRARELLQQANAEKVDRNAPRTLDRAKTLVRQAENLLQQDRYDTDEADRVSKEAAYEAAHALYLNRTIAQIRNEKKSFEDVLLTSEAALAKVADAADVSVQFDEGFDKPVQVITSRLREQANREQVYMERIRQQETELAQLRKQIADKGDLAELLEMQRKRDEAINNVVNLFNPHEGNVFIDGNNVLIRLYGLTFPVGRSIIEPQFFGLLTRVQEAIKRFPNCRVIIEGHTDSRGGAELNQRLSEERAAAVAEYIRANIGIPLEMTSLGYGPDRPVASNETEEGRAKNRRIDVVIVPEWAMTDR
jgi:OmpA-OmpF porin, OOP family